jgi:hypothetical protein
MTTPTTYVEYAGTRYRARRTIIGDYRAERYVDRRWQSVDAVSHRSAESALLAIRKASGVSRG